MCGKTHQERHDTSADITEANWKRYHNIAKSKLLYFKTNGNSKHFLKQGGTGYAITNDNLEAKEKRPALQS